LINLGQNKARPCSSHHIERKFAKDGIYGGLFNCLKEFKIPISPNSEFHDLIKNNMKERAISREITWLSRPLISAFFKNFKF
jgi:hypothetical protein